MLILPVVIETDSKKAQQDAQHKRWYAVTGIGENGVVSGWIAESQLKDVSQFDWQGLGFGKVEEANDNADGYMDPGQLPEFRRPPRFE